MKSDKAVAWFVRITAPWEHLEKKYKEVRAWIDHDVSAVGYHIGEKTAKPHCHIALKLRKELQKQSLDTRMKQLFGVKGCDYSSKIWDGSHKVLSYLYHDKGGKVEVNMPLTDAQKDEIEKTATVYEEIVTQAKSKASNKMVDVILQEIAEAGRRYSDREIMTRIFEGVRTTQWHNPRGMLFGYVEEIVLRQGSIQEQMESQQAMVDYYMSRYHRS